MNPSERIDELIAELTDWSGKTLARIRKIIFEAILTQTRKTGS